MAAQRQDRESEYRNIKFSYSVYGSGIEFGGTATIHLDFGYASQDVLLTSIQDFESLADAENSMIRSVRQWIDQCVYAANCWYKYSDVKPECSGFYKVFIKEDFIVKNAINPNQVLVAEYQGKDGWILEKNDLKEHAINKIDSEVIFWKKLS